MKSNAILVNTSDEGLIAIKVSDFSKENVINAIAQEMAIKKEHISQTSASISYGIYSIPSHCFTSRIEPYKEYCDSEINFYFRIDYIKVLG